MHLSSTGTLVRALVLVLCLAGPVAAAPFDVKPDRPTPPAPTLSEGGRVPTFMRPLIERISAAQRELNRTMSRELRAVRDSGSRRALLIVTGVAFVYGVLHAAGPGHGKLVVSSFFLARHAR